MSTIVLAESVLRTARHTMRLIRSSPGFVVTVVLSLALGIGANTTIFSVVNEVLIQPLPYPRADDMVGIYNRMTISSRCRCSPSELRPRQPPRFRRPDVDAPQRVIGRTGANR